MNEKDSPAQLAAIRLNAYSRVVRASLEGDGLDIKAPVMYLSDDMLAALFTPHQASVLVSIPLGRTPAQC